jgi:hypothetical protein
MDAAGTKALLANGSTARMSARLLAPAGVLAISPDAAVSQVRAMPAIASTPASAIRSSGVAAGRRPSAKAAPTTRAPLSRLRRRLPATWPLSTAVRVTAMARNRVMMPSVISVTTFSAVPSAAQAAVITRMPGAR